MAVGSMLVIPLPILAPTVGALYLIYLILSRLYFSPIASFPGPKLAAVTRWYEFYYDVVLKGRFTFHIQELHRKYGISATPPTSWMLEP